jgi:drug/metabolite transporter (DMT)-like permease
MSRRAWVLFIAMSALWGLPYLLIKIAVADLQPTLLVFVRLGMAAIVLLPIAIATGSLTGIRRRWRRLVLIAVIGIVAPFLLIAYGELHVTSSLAALLIASDPLFVVLMALPFDRSERPGGARLMGLLLGFVGVAVLLGLDVGGDTLGVIGGVLIVLASICYATSALLVKGLKGMPMLGSATLTVGLAAIILAPAAAFNLPSSLPGPNTIIAILALGLVCTALAYVLYYSLIVEAGAARASIITYVNPAVAVLLGVLVLREPFTGGTLVGFGLIILGCALATGVLHGRRQLARPRRISGAELAEGDVS